ncbi:LYR motif-containing protein [Aspergillus aculeatinus CBS 121060]|uniref:Mitochondrial zinc maintenance protein 1, mitochondrial n=4 Tax=Aspergillus TaxID=5052 RepID=A0A319C2L8_9EURO|nr:mitochondrial zinc maintenance protein 1, mitochondrial [Aspergillus brunneoviolaceus CBS 621.78]XP_025490446.1 mitochondrial zinc maintenance protein 1, mitochondrial [Aspergillus uvarum CBS 121591]XP_025502602.1 mitochondrial zinc maintenance protein 1, mitochondrial [Aspergillus aculeatinus CBS 121060]XP_040805212.1 mitochondrial zinc maintenance protein 1, mitochondrial [Aspergillus fijiensis CBS 313.89]PYH80246.1 mitochondrial zinc maintenance protein 1, mitochondrial [Aspergillus uvaru
MASQGVVSARSAYRQLLRATRVAFHNDLRVMVAARQEARRNFDNHPRQGIDTPMQINHAIEVANILRHNIVQGVRDDGDENAKWELRIHDEIERGDNDSIKIAGKKVKVDKPCSA